MSKFLKVLLVVAMSVIFMTSFATANTFVVDDDGDPLTTFPTLAGAVATAETFGGGPHDIVIMPGAYSDAAITFTVPGQIASIIGDSGSEAADIVFTDPTYQTNFFMSLSGSTGMILNNFTIAGYATGIFGNGVNADISGLVFDDNTNGVYMLNTDGSIIDGNEFFGGTTGIRLLSTGGDPSDANMITNNNIHDVGGNGIYLGDGGVAHFGNDVGDNVLMNCGLSGIAIISGNAALISGNQSQDNGSFGVALTLGTYVGGPLTVSDNCFYGHSGVQASDNAAHDWEDNYYGDITVGATTYALAGGGGAIDSSPKMRSNTPVAGSSTMEVWSSQVVDFMWMLPDVCDPADAFDFAAYEFTVSWDITKLDYVGGDNTEFFTNDGFYIVTDNSATGSITFSGVDIANPNTGAGALAWAEFQAITVGSATITVGSSYRDTENNEIPVMNGSLALTLVDTEAPAITVTANNPIGDDVYSDGYGNVQLFVEGTVTDNFGVSSVWYRFNDTGIWTKIKDVTGISDTYGGLPTDYYLDITGLADGANNVNLICVDASANRDSVYYNFDIDRTGPDVANLALADSDGCADLGYSSSDDVIVSWDNADGSAVEYELYYTLDPPWSGPVALENPTTFTLDGTEGSHGLYVRQYDVYGNMGPQMGPVNIMVDHTAPVPSAAWLVTSPTPAVTNVTTIVGDFNMDVAGGTVEFMTSEVMGDIVCGAAGWAAAPPTVRPFAIELSGGDGTKVVYFGSRDAAGNVATTSATIELDGTPPEFISFAVEDATGTECSDSWVVKVIVEYDADAVDVGLYNVTGGPYYYVALDGTSPDTVDYHFITNGDGTSHVCNDVNTVFGVLRDAATNEGAEVSDDIIVDCGGVGAITVLLRDLDYSGAFPPHGNWSNDAEVNIEITGLDVDVVELLVSEDGLFAGEETIVAITSADPFNFNYTHSAPTECGASSIYIIARDCAGHSSGSASDAITFDFTDPVIADFIVTTENPTDVLSADVSMTLTDNCNAYQMKVYEDGYGGAATWGVDAPTATVALADDGDGVRTIVIEFSDPAGNIATTSATVEVDQTAPSGTFNVEQSLVVNPLVTPGYTNLLTVDIVDIVGVDGAVEMAIRNDDGSNNTGWISLATPHTPFSLVGGGDGMRTVQMIFKDAAGNFLAWVDAIEVDIMYLGTAPAAPSNATGTPTASVYLEWDAVTDANFYIVRFNRTELYPTYEVSPPPHPMTLVQGLPAYQGSDPFATFEGPGPDIYSFSIWTVDLAGNYSVTPNTEVKSTNYILGDINLDGEITFVDDFGTFSTCYLLGTADPGFNADCDFGPTTDASGTGLPIPDGLIDLEDLIVMGMNYDTYSKSADDFDLEQGNGKLVPGELNIIAAINEAIIPNSEFTVIVSISNAEVLKAYNLILNYDRDDAELVSVSAGEIHTNSQLDFFYDNSSSSTIDITGMVLGSEFEGNEMVKLVFKSKSGEFSLESKELTLRDNSNQEINATFETVAKVIPTQFSLRQNYPNPFNPSTTIEFMLPKETDFTLTVFNITGQKVHVFEGHAQAGKVAVDWNATDRSSGVYFYKLEADTFADTKKMVLLK